MTQVEHDPQGLVLAEVRDMGPTTAREIATETGLSESTVRRVLRHLEQTGLVESDNYQRRSHVWMATES